MIGMLNVLFMLFLSFVASPALFVKRFEGLKDFYNKVSGYRAVIGVVYLVYGILLMIEMFVEHAYFMQFISALLIMSLGFLMGFQWLTENIFQSNEKMQIRLKGVYYSLMPYEGSLAIVALILAIYHFINWL